MGQAHRDYVIGEMNQVIGPRAYLRTDDFAFSMRVRRKDGKTGEKWAMPLARTPNGGLKAHGKTWRWRYLICAMILVSRPMSRTIRATSSWLIGFGMNWTASCLETAGLRAIGVLRTRRDQYLFRGGTGPETGLLASDRPDSIAWINQSLPGLESHMVSATLLAGLDTEPSGVARVS